MNALAGVLVRVRKPHSANVGEGRTSSAGAVGFPLKPGRYKVTAYLTPPAVPAPGRACEVRTVIVRPKQVTVVPIACSIR